MNLIETLGFSEVHCNELFVHWSPNRFNSEKQRGRGYPLDLIKSNRGSHLFVSISKAWENLTWQKYLKTLLDKVSVEKKKGFLTQEL